MSDESFVTCPVHRIGTIPEVISVVRSNSVVNSPECTATIGPVATVSRVDDDQVLAIANRVKQGLAAYVFNRDISRCHSITQRLTAVRCPSTASATTWSFHRSAGRRAAAPAVRASRNSCR